MMPRFRRLALIQPRPGIGDMVWHLPHLRALAAHADAPCVLVTKSRARAEQLLGPADGIGAILAVERGQWRSGDRHEGVSGLRRLVADLRALECDGAMLLSRSRTLAWSALAAGIPRRHGYGLGGTRFTLRPPFLPEATRDDHPHAQATAWMALTGIAMPSAEPRLLVSEPARDAARARFGADRPAPVAIGIAGSDAWKQWGAPRFAALIGQLAEAGWSEIALLGGAAEREVADAILRTVAPPARVTALLDWDLRTLAALLSTARFYVGNDTAVLNIAAAVGLRSYGLFGATPVLRHSRLITPIVPPGGPDRDYGMARITPEMVARAILGDRRA